MQRLLCVLFSLLFPCLAIGQFIDDFSDGNFNSNPKWHGDTSLFIVNPALELRLDNAGTSSSSYLSTPSVAIKNAVWEFDVRLDFNPSSNNLSKVYLASDTSVLTASLNGYFVKIGNTSDEVSLYRQDGLSETEIIDGRDDLIDTDPVIVHVRVTRDSIGNWSLESDTSVSGGNYILEGTISDTTYRRSDYFGVHCKYTSTRGDKFFFDNFMVTGTRYVDRSPPRLLEYRFPDPRTITLRFNEPLLASSVDPADFALSNGFNSPDRALLSGAAIRLEWDAAFPNGSSFTLNYSGFSDLEGNDVLPDSITLSYYRAQLYDILISEILPIPSPSVNLPEWEFVELYNRSAFSISLENWQFSDASSSRVLPPVTLAPAERLILCDEDAVSLYFSYGRTLGIQGFPTLNNSGDEISIRDSLGNLIHRVVYSDSWFRDPLKSSGGWSLELIDADFPCVGASNWSASTSREGGTPGSANSVQATNPDQTSPGLLRLSVNSPKEIRVFFDESLDESSATNSSNFILRPGSFGFDSLRLAGTDNNQVILYLDAPLQGEITYSLTISGVGDCSGNSMPAAISKRLGLPSEPKSGDILINELLFEPVSGGDDFIELYNYSQKLISLDKLLLVKKDLQGVVLDQSRVSESAILLFPGDYVALTNNVLGLKGQYLMAPDSSLLDSDIPNFDAEEGRVELQTAGLEFIDGFSYNSDMHYPLLQSTKGVSLERIRFDISAEESSNWFSAAKELNYGTPGYRNSQFRTATDMMVKVDLSNKTVTPNGDGVDDFLVVNYKSDKAGSTGSAFIYNARGELIRTIFRNSNLAAEGQIIWDGLSDNNQQAPTGAYIIYFEYFNLEGNTKAFKEAFLVDLLH